MKIEWGRVYRGTVWHLLDPNVPDFTLCQLSPATGHVVREATERLPPRGGRLCSDCVHDVQEWARAIELAREQEPPGDGQLTSEDLGQPRPHLRQLATGEIPGLSG